MQTTLPLGQHLAGTGKGWTLGTMRNRPKPVRAATVVDVAKQNAEILALLRSLSPQGALDAAAMPVRIPSAHEVGISWEAFCTDADLEWERPKGFNVMKHSTFEYRERIRRQLVKEGVQLDPPDLASANAWLDGKKATGRSKASFEHHRRVFEDVLLYYGEPVPLAWSKPWGTKKTLDRARSEGKLRKYNRFLRDGIADLQRALKAKPWKNEKNVAMFRHALFLCFLAGPRGSEPATLRLADVLPQRHIIENFFQEKKSESRDVVIPEAWFWNGPANSVRDYLAYVRPALVGDKPDPGTYFVNSEGNPYTEAAWRQFMQNGLRGSLGYPIGPHALRRLCATMRYVYGWDFESIAAHLDDTEGVVRASYVDEGYVRRVGRQPSPHAPRPSLPQVWQMVKGLHGKEQA